MNNEQIRKAIIKDVDKYFMCWGSIFSITLASSVEEIVNKHFGHDKN